MSELLPTFERPTIAIRGWAYPLKNPSFTSFGIWAVSANVTMKGSFVVISPQVTMNDPLKSRTKDGMRVAQGDPEE
jgi:hypothetical protein